MYRPIYYYHIDLCINIELINRATSILFLECLKWILFNCKRTGNISTIPCTAHHIKKILPNRGQACGFVSVFFIPQEVIIFHKSLVLRHFYQETS